MAVSDAAADDVIDLFISIVGGISRERAIRILKFHNNSAEVAINDYFEDPNSSKYDRDPLPNQVPDRWDEDAFHSDRYGTSNNTGISFKIEGSDEFPPQYGPHYNPQGDGAPSRPPSRTGNNRSPQNRVIDMTEEAANADPSKSVYRDISNVDTDMDMAIRASLLPPQESGVTNTDQVAFGPATRSQYEQGKWDLVPMSKTYSQEILIDPEPADRKRDLGVPAFLKPSVDDNRLGALLTIYHEIPLIRELFLDRKNVVNNYGNDREWWMGKAIELPMVTETGTEEGARDAFLQEAQRLMAFLDKTDRSYGSADALANQPFVESFRPTKGSNVENAVLEAYKYAFSNYQARLRILFSRGVDGPEENNDQEFAILELPLPSKDSYAETIYDIADEVLWGSSNSAPLDLSHSAFLTNIGEVITFRFSTWGDAKKNGIVIPAVWYPDRYLDSGREAAFEMRKAKREHEKELLKIGRLEDALTEFELSSGKRIKVEDLFKAALQHDVGEVEGDSSMTRDHSDEDLESLQRSAKNKNLSTELRKLSERIDRKLKALGEQKEKTKDALRQLSKLYTEPSDDPNQPALHKYTLRGVSTSKNTIYICRQAEPDLIDMDLESEDSTPKGDQWWMINYAPSESKPVQVEKTIEEKVLAAASESNTSMLVYASEKAMAWHSQPLPIPLETFVRKDNALFKSEFPASDSPVSSPKSPKRKSDPSESSDEALDGRMHKSNVKISEREVGESDLEGPQTAASSLAQSVVQNGNSGPEIIMGLDPSIQDSPVPAQEMQERSSMRILSARPMDGAKKPIDIMDLDQVMEDDNVAQESGAVKHVGFMD